MSRLEEILGLPPTLNSRLKDLRPSDSDDDDDPDPPNSPAAIPQLPAGIDPMEVTPVQMAQHEGEMEDIADKALVAFDQMKDLAFGVEAKYAGTIFEPMVQVLNLAMQAKSAKIDRKMKMMRLQLERDRLEHQKSLKVNSQFIENETPQGEMIDRNSLLDQYSPPKPT